MSEFLAGHHYKELEKTQGALQTDPTTWFAEFIKEVRPRYASLAEDSRGGIVHLDDFEAPCQVLVFWVREPERQFIFVTKEDSLPDLSIEIHGPLEIGQALNEIGKVLQESWLRKLVKVDGLTVSYRDVLEQDLIGLVRILQFEVFHPEIAGPGTIIKRGPEHCRWFTWNAVGNLTIADPKEFAFAVSQRWSELGNQPAAPPSPVAAPSQPEQVKLVKGYCTYVFPPIWIGKRPEPDYIQKLYGIPVHSWLQFQAQITYRQRRLGLGMTGQMAIGEEDKIACMRYLNEIACVATLSGLPMHVIRESDLGEIEMTSDGQIRSLAYPTSPTRRRLAEIEFGGINESFLQEFREVPQEKIVGIVRTAEKTIDSQVKSDCAGLVAEAYTLLVSGQYGQSFTSSWLALEKYLVEVWRSTRPTRDRHPRVDRKAVALVIKELHSKGFLRGKQFERIETLRKKRNEVSHEGSVTHANEAEECFRDSASVVGHWLGILGRQRGSDYGEKKS